MRDKTRDFTCTSFYYNLKEMESLNVTDIYHTDGYLNFENVQNGSITINRSIRNAMSTQPVAASGPVSSRPTIIR